MGYNLKNSVSSVKEEHSIIRLICNFKVFLAYKDLRVCMFGGKRIEEAWADERDQPVTRMEWLTILCFQWINYS